MERKFYTQHMTKLTPKQIQDNLIAYHRHFQGVPGITFTEEDDVTWIAGKSPPGNTVFSTSFAGDNADQRIDETLQQIGQHADAVDWFVFPDCEPSDLGERLRRRGEVDGPDGEWMLHGDIGGPGGTWMWMELSKLAAPPVMPDGFRITQVTNQQLLDEWTDINARGFGCEDYSAFHAAYSQLGFGPDAEVVHFIGYLNDEPATSSSILMAGGSASVYNVSTPKEMRRQGLGCAITHIGLQHAREAGYQETWIWASKLGKSVYAKLGFTMQDFGLREYPWKKRKRNEDKYD